MNLKNLVCGNISKKVICLILLAIMAIISFTVISKYATSPETYSSTIKSIDDKKASVMAVTAAAAVTSTALAAIPGDVTTPIANQIMEISSYLIIVVCALVLEKSLLTVAGYLAFNFLIPIACLLLGIYVFVKKDMLKMISIKLVVFALIIVFIVPFSMKVSDMIFELNKTTIEQVADDSVVSVDDNSDKEEKPWYTKILSKVKNSVEDAGEKAKEVMNKFIDAIALFIIIYCAMPIIILLLVVWLANLILGISIPVSGISLKRRKQKPDNDNLNNQV